MIASPDQHAQQTTSFGASSSRVSAIYGEEATVCVVPSRGRLSSPTMACLACCPMDLGGARLQRSREACIGQPMVPLGYGRMQGLSRCQRLDLLRPQAVSWGILGERDRGLCRSRAEHQSPTLFSVAAANHSRPGSRRHGQDPTRPAFVPLQRAYCLPGA